VYILATLDKIKALLKEQNKTQKQLMDYLGLGKTAFTGWNSGANTSYNKHIGKIAEFLNVSTDYLLYDENKNTPDEQILTEGEKLWLDLYHQLSTETRAVLVNMANAFETLPCDRQKFLLDAIRFAVENQK
jgi:transcriptional regulator with XRE-family HTH domain